MRDDLARAFGYGFVAASEAMAACIDYAIDAEAFGAGEVF
jgi:hypothetical protein